MARQGETTNPSEDLTVRSLADYAADEAKRHRATTELRLPDLDATRPASTIPPGSKDATGVLTDELREGLWAAIVTYLFAPSSPDDRWAGAPSTRPAIQRVWVSPPIAADAGDIPEDIEDLIEEWFSIASNGDVYALVESVLGSLPDAQQPQFLTAVNLVLERGLSDHRFVGRRLMPIASRTDVATLEKTLLACRTKKLAETETNLLAALDHLAEKPEPDALAAVHASIRAVQATAFALTKERPLDLDDALDMLEAQGHIDAAIKARHGGLFAWVAQNARKPRPEDARLILVTCAAFVTQLAARL